MCRGNTGSRCTKYKHQIICKFGVGQVWWQHHRPILSDKLRSVSHRYLSTCTAVLPSRLDRLQPPTPVITNNHQQQANRVVAFVNIVEVLCVDVSWEWSFEMHKIKTSNDFLDTTSTSRVYQPRPALFTSKWKHKQGSLLWHFLRNSTPRIQWRNVT